MKKTRTKIIGLILMLFVLAVTPACDAFWEIMETDTNQVDDNNNNNNDQGNDQSNTSKGKR